MDVMCVSSPMTIFVLNFKAEKHKMICGDSKNEIQRFGVASANFQGVIKPLSHFKVSYNVL